MNRVDNSKLQRRVVHGDFMCSSLNSETNELESDLLKWRPPKNKLLVFVSSTFTDTQHERNVLLGKILPRLREKARFMSIGVSFVDMRFGVRDESTLDHKTWVDCAMELKRCHEESTGMFFLSLQADKYGYRPLPRTFDKDAFENRMNSMSDEQFGEAKSLAAAWYHLDKNSHPNGQYLLRKLESTNDTEYWESVLPTIRDALSDIAFEPKTCEDLIMGRSVSEWEVKYALHLDSELSRLGWVRRQFEGGIDETHEKSWAFHDCREPSSKLKLDNLIGWMTSSLTPSNDSSYYYHKPTEKELFLRNPIVPCKRLTMDSYVNGEGPDFAEYISDWEEKMEEKMNAELEKIKKYKYQWCSGSDAIYGLEYAEVLQHAEWAHDKIKSFVGREDLLQQAVSLARQENRGADKKPSQRENFEGICMCLIGRSGSGKTALMSKLAHELFCIEDAKPDLFFPVEKPKQESYKRPVIIRFCGTSDGSSDAYGLVVSICLQIAALFGDSQLHRQSLDSYEKACKCFEKLIQKFAVLLLIDSLDQLSDADLARSTLSFLRRVKPHRDSRIIVSALPDEKDSESGEWIYCYGCESRMREGNVPKLEVPVLDIAVSNPAAGNISNNAKHIMQQLLRSKGRDLTECQWTYVLHKFAQEPTALYMTLAVFIVSEWSDMTMVPPISPLKSDQVSPRRSNRVAEEVNEPLCGSVAGLIGLILDNVENIFGTLLAQTVLTVLTISIGGVTDAELEDILSQDEEVLNFVFQYHTPTLRRLPAHVWSRIRNFLKGLLIEREKGCVVWYHRQLREVCEKRYGVDIKFRQKLHGFVGRYFANIVESKFLESRAIASHPLVLDRMRGRDVNIWQSHCNVNYRRCQQGAYHLIRAHMFPEAVAELCNLEVVCANLRCGRGSETLQNLVDLEDELSNEVKLNNEGNENLQKLLRRTKHYASWFRMSGTALSNANSAQLSSTIFTTCTALEPLTSVVREDALAFLQATEAPQALNPPFSGKYWYRGRSPPQDTDFGLLQSKLQGHKRRIFCVSWSPDDTRIASGSEDGEGYIWSAKAGNIVAVLGGHHRTSNLAGIHCVVWDKMGKRIVTGNGEGVVRLHDSFTGAALQTFRGHKYTVNDCAWSRDETSIVSASSEGIIRMWNVESGEQEWEIKDTLSDSKSMVAVWAVAWSPRDDIIATCTSNGELHFRSPSDGSLVKDVKKSGESYAICYNRTGTEVMLASRDGQITVFDTQTYEPKCSVGYEKGKRGITNFDWSPDQRLVAAYGSASIAGYSDRDVTIFDLGSGDIVRRLMGHTGTVGGIAWSHNGKNLVTAGHDQVIDVWNLSPDSEISKPVGHSQEISGVSFHPSGNTIASTSKDGSVCIWNASSLSLLRKTSNHTKPIHAMAYSPDGTMLATSSEDLILCIWSISSEDGTHTLGGIIAKDHVEGFEGFSKVINAMHWHENRLACACKDETIKIFQVNSGQTVTASLIHTFKGEPNEYQNLAWSPDGCTIAAGGKPKVVLIWDVASAISSGGVGYRPTEGRIKQKLTRTIRLVNGVDPEKETPDTTFLLHTIAMPDNYGIGRMCFSPDGSVLYLSYLGSYRYGYDTKTWQMHRSRIDHPREEPIGDMVFSPSGDHFMTVGYKSIAIWSYPGCGVICEIHGFVGSIRHASWRADCQRIVTAGSSHTITIWDAVEFNTLKSVM